MPYIAKGHPPGASGVAQCVELFEPAMSAVTIVEGAAAMVLSGGGVLIPARDDVRLNAAVTER